MTRQTLTFDSFFNENILDQGTGYRYDMGVSHTYAHALFEFLRLL